MKLGSILSFIVIGAFLGGVGYSFLSEPAARNGGYAPVVDSSALEPAALAGKTPVVTVTDIPVAAQRTNVGD